MWYSEGTVMGADVNHNASHGTTSPISQFSKAY